MIRTRLALASIALLALMPTPGSADYSIFGQQAAYTVNAGGTVSINIFIAGEGTTPELLNSYGAEFRINAATGQTGPTIQYTSPQPDGYLGPGTGSTGAGSTPYPSNYALLGASSDVDDFSGSTGGRIASRAGTFLGSFTTPTDLSLQDSVDNSGLEPNPNRLDATGNNVTLAPSSPVVPGPGNFTLLTQLTIMAPTTITTPETFTLNLIGETASNGNTFFYYYDAGSGQFVDPGFTYAPITITVSAVPEPASALMMGIGLVSGSYLLRRRRASKAGAGR